MVSTFNIIIDAQIPHEYERKLLINSNNFIFMSKLPLAMSLISIPLITGHPDVSFVLLFMLVSLIQLTIITVAIFFFYP